MKVPPPDVCVLGAGPAGAAAACRLATLGYRVDLIERGGGLRERPVVESVGPPVSLALDTLGALNALQGSAFQRIQTTRSRWDSPRDSVREAPAALIERGRFDRLLRQAAQRAGARLLQPAQARRAVRAGPGWRVEIENWSGGTTIEVPFLVDARGRRTAPPLEEPATVALQGRWRGVVSPPIGEMRVEAVEDAWLWGAPGPDGEYCVLAFVDLEACKGLGAVAREARYRTLVASSALLGFCARGVLAGRVSVRDATPRLEPVCADEISVCAGERAFAMDPISSQGVQAALRSGIQAAAVAHTILSGGDAGAALEFHNQAQCRASSRHARARAAVYREVLFRTHFWQARSAARGQLPVPSTTMAPDARLRLSPQALVIAAPLMDGNVIHRGSALSHPGLEEPVAWVDGVALAPLIETFGEGGSYSAILEAWQRRLAPAVAQHVLNWLVRNGVVEAV